MARTSEDPRQREAYIVKAGRREADDFFGLAKRFHLAEKVETGPASNTTASLFLLLLSLLSLQRRFVDRIIRRFRAIPSKKSTLAQG